MLYVCDSDTGRQEGGLQDSDIEILHLLLSHLVTQREQFGIAPETLDTFLKAVRRGNILSPFFLLIELSDEVTFSPLFFLLIELSNEVIFSSLLFLHTEQWGNILIPAFSPPQWALRRGNILVPAFSPQWAVRWGDILSSFFSSLSCHTR